MNKPGEALARPGRERIEAAVAEQEQKTNQETAPDTAVDENLLIKQRRQKADQIKELGLNLYPNTFRPRDSIGELCRTYGQVDAARLDSLEYQKFSLAGRIMAIRSFGKAAFLKITDRTGSLQLHLQRDVLPPAQFQLFKKLDVGDIVGVRGSLFRTRTRELTHKAEDLWLVTKGYRPLPEKFHGLTDVEVRYRQRYLDLIMNDRVRDIFVARSKIVATIRRFLDERDFLEVETPMMQLIPGGATARPFETYHNALA